MNIQSWILENKRASTLVLVFLIGTGLLSYLAWVAWDDFGTVTAEYSSQASKLDSLAHNTIFPSASNLKKLVRTLEQNQESLSKLNEGLQAYRIHSFGTFDKVKPQDQPQYFQDSLRSEVTAVKSLAMTNGSTLPATFYLGLDEYENQLPQPELLPILSKQLTVLDWLGKSLVGLKGVIVAEFSRVPSNATKGGAPSGPQRLPAASLKVSSDAAPQPYDSLGSVLITLRCGQGELRELVNTISSSPYFFVIEDIRIQNSAEEPPPRNTAPTADQPADGTNSVQRLPIIVGHEAINVLLKIRMIDFPAMQNQPEISQ